MKQPGRTPERHVADLEHALKRAVEELAYHGWPRQNWAQFRRLVANALGVDEEDDAEMLRFRRLHSEAITAQYRKMRESNRPNG